MRKSAGQKNIVPKAIQNIDQWKWSRKQFIRSMVAGGLVARLPFSKLIGQVQKNDNPILTSDQLSIIRSVQAALFPKDEFGPGATDINAATYLLWVLADPQKDPDEVEYIINGIGWVDETAFEEYETAFIDLSPDDREQLIALISRTNWGESWLSVILTFIFEALLSDPQYGSNPNSIGWKWLDHNTGQPRPSKELLYPKILTTIRKS